MNLYNSTDHAQHLITGGKDLNDLARDLSGVQNFLPFGTLWGEIKSETLTVTAKASAARGSPGYSLDYQDMFPDCSQRNGLPARHAAAQ